jgi:hypothetical protein
LLATLMSIPTGGRHRPLNLSPQKQREKRSGRTPLAMPRVRARAGVVPISELVFGTLNQNWSSLRSAPGRGGRCDPP